MKPIIIKELTNMEMQLLRSRLHEWFIEKIREMDDRYFEAILQKKSVIREKDKVVFHLGGEFNGQFLRELLDKQTTKSH